MLTVAVERMLSSYEKEGRVLFEVLLVVLYYIHVRTHVVVELPVGTLDISV